MATRSWHIHLGAHKTATTHLQTELAARQQELNAKGAFYLPHKDAREMLMFRTVPRPFWYRFMKLYRASHPASAFVSMRFCRSCAKHLQVQIDERAGKSTRVVLSEENLLGTSDKVFGGRYFSGTEQLNVLRILSERVPLHLYLSTRSLDSFLPSAYAQALRSIPASRLNFMDHLHRFADGAPGWLNLVASIRSKVPKAVITVWDYADYTTKNHTLQSLIAGCDLDVRSTIPRPKSTQSPSAKAIALAEKLPETDPKKRLRAVNAIYASHPAGDKVPPFRPIPENIQQRLQEAYVRELNQIGVLQGVTRIQFDARRP